MNKLTLFIEGNSKEVILDESLLILHDKPHLFIKTASIFWNLNNVFKDNNDKIT